MKTFALILTLISQNGATETEVYASGLSAQTCILTAVLAVPTLSDRVGLGGIKEIEMYCRPETAA